MTGAQEAFGPLPGVPGGWAFTSVSSDFASEGKRVFSLPMGSCLTRRPAFWNMRPPSLVQNRQNELRDAYLQRRGTRKGTSDTDAACWWPLSEV